MYLSISDATIASALVREDAKQQHPIYFVSKALQGLELRYQKLEKVVIALMIIAQKLEKVVIALMIIARCLYQYFQAHPIVDRTNQPVQQILQKLDLAGRMVTWSLELLEFDIQYEPKTTIKAQLSVDFLVEMIDDKESQAPKWTLYVNRSSSTKESGAREILEKEGEVVVKLSIKFDFPVSDNQADYKALIARLRLTIDMGAT